MDPPWGTLSAINIDTGRYAWKIPFGEYPELAARGQGGTGSENYGGAVVTAGGLLFIASGPDRMVHALDKDTGKTLWEYKAPAAIEGMPAVYASNGREYIVFCAAGRDSARARSIPGQPASQASVHGSYIAFALPQ